MMLSFGDVARNVAEAFRRQARAFEQQRFLVPAAAGFFFFWMGMNVYIPFVGEGYNGYGECLAAALIFWSWSNSTATREKRRQTGQGQVPDYKEIIILKFFAVAFYYGVGRLVLPLILPVDNGLGGLLALFVMSSKDVITPMLTKGPGRTTHHRGTQVISEREAKAEVRTIGGGSEPRLEFAGFDLPGEVAPGNFLTVGAIGTGKTRIHRRLMESVFPHLRPGSGRRALVYDTKSDSLAELESLDAPCGLTVMDAYDTRSLAWNLAADITGTEEATNFAAALIPTPSGGTEKTHFARAAQNIVAATIERLNKRLPGEWTLRDLVLILSSRDRTERFHDGSDILSEFFTGTEAADDTRSTIANTMRPLRPIAACWEHSAPFSVKEWLDGRESVVVLAGKPGDVGLESINRVFCTVASHMLAKGPESSEVSRFWFFCDELRNAGRLDVLGDLLNSRSKGVRSVLGFQDLEGLTAQYGDRDRVLSIINNCASVSWLRLESDGTAEWASHRVGQFEQFEYTDAVGKDGTTVTEHLTKREAVLPSEFMQQPGYRGGAVTGIHKFYSTLGVFKSCARYSPFAGDKSRNFLPRPEWQKELREWGPDDEVRLGMAEDDERQPDAEQQPHLPFTPSTDEPEAAEDAPLVAATGGRAFDLSDFDRVTFR